MPSYLYPAQNVPVQPYEQPLALYSQVLQIKDAKFKGALNNIRNRYDSILSTPLTNESNQMTLRTNMEKAMQRLSQTAVGDLNLPENQASIESSFDSVVNDPNLLYDMAWTRNHRKELSKAENLQKTKPELVPPQNLEPLYMSQKAYQQGDPGSRPNFTQFTPYYDFNTKVNGDLDKIKADIDNQIVQGRGLKIQGPDGNVIDIDNLSQQQIKEIKASKVSELTWKRLQTDAQALNQMNLDYNYNTNHGFYSDKQANLDIDSDVQTIKSRIDYYSLGVKAGQIPQDKANGVIKGYNQQIEDLVNLKNQIKIDPSNAKKYYTFNKSIKDYVESKADQYSYREESKLEDVPGYSKLMDYQFDLMKERWKSKFDQDNESLKAKLKISMSGQGSIPTPYKDLIVNLEESTNGRVAASQTDAGALGNFTVKDGKYYHSFGQDGADPSQSLIIQPASGDFTQEQTSALSKAQVMYGLNRDLNALGIRHTEDHWEGYADTGGGGGKMVHGPVEHSAQDILKNLALNPNFYGPDSKKVQDVVSKYQPALDKFGIDVKNPKELLSIQNQLKDPQIAKALTFGQTLSHLNGDFQVVTEGDNVVKGQSGEVYVKGKMIVPISRIGGGMARDLIKANIASYYGVGVSGGDDDGKYKKSNEELVAINFYKPVNGNVEDINDKMLMDSKRLEGQADNIFPIREASRQAIRDFGQLQSISSQYSLPGASFTQVDKGKYVLDQSNKPVLNKINQISWEISTRTGVPLDKIQQDVSNIIAINPTAIRRAEAIQNYEYNLNIQNQAGANGFRTFANYEEGRKALEDQLDLYKTGKTSNKVGPDSTLLQAMSVYAPTSDGNNPKAYAQFIADKLGVTVNTPISQIDTKKWADAVEIVEKNTKGNNPGNLRP